ncbi:MAG: hypothetical protein WDZ90_00305 [Candidatus Paceibacterota bacterium]
MASLRTPQGDLSLSEVAEGIKERTFSDTGQYHLLNSLVHTSEEGRELARDVATYVLAHESDFSARIVERARKIAS